MANSVVPDKPEIMVFAVPTEKGSYQGFAYEAIAVTYNNKDLVDSLKISAFEGARQHLCRAAGWPCGAGQQQ